MRSDMIIYVLIAHWVSDFVFQSNWEAQNKSKNFDALLRHVITYTFAMEIFVSAMFPISGVALLQFAAVTFVLHFATDWITSRINAKLFKDQLAEWISGDNEPVMMLKPGFNPHWFFVSVGFDQFLHYAQLFLTLKVLTS